MQLDTTHALQIFGLLVTAIAAPLFWKLANDYLGARKEAREARVQSLISARLDAYAEEHDDMDRKQMETYHRQNTAFLDTIRTEAQKREGTIVGHIDAWAKVQGEAITRLNGDVSKVHERIDRVLELQGDRRGRRQ